MNRPGNITGESRADRCAAPVEASRNGFTVAEMAVSSAILIIAVAMAMSGFVYVLSASREGTVQDELDIQVQIAMEGLKKNLRLSSLDEMVFYPAGPGPYTAISFPLARDDDDEPGIDLDEEGRIIWDKTLVYHVWNTAPQQLRLTTFDPRDTNLSAVARQEQIESVVINGHGTNTHNGVNSTNAVIFENLFDWSITPQNSIYDGYASTTQRDVNVTLGSCVISNGTHDFKFTVIGKNSNVTSSTGYKVGIDNLYVSPSYSRREGEHQVPSDKTASVAYSNMYMGGGSWNANYQAYFNATTSNQYFTLTLTNDLWQETIFRRTGYSIEDAAVTFLQQADSNYVVHPEAEGLNNNGTTYSYWNAYEQCGLTTTGWYQYGERDIDQALRGCAVRVFVKGEDMAYGGEIDNDSSSQYGWVYGGGSNDAMQCGIVEGYIAECAGTNELTPNVVGSTLTQLRFVDTTVSPFPPASYSTLITNGLYSKQYRRVNYHALPIEKEKTYTYTFLITNTPGQAHVASWPDIRDPAGIAAYIITNATHADVMDPYWEGRGDVIPSSRHYLLGNLDLKPPTNSYYVSGPFDTRDATPAYNEVSWNAFLPLPAYCFADLQVRTASDMNMTDAEAWTNLPVLSSSPAAWPDQAGTNQFVQWRAHLWRTAPNSAYVAVLKDVTIKWAGPTRTVDIGGTFTKGPNYGIFQLEVDGVMLRRGLSVDLEIYEDVYGYGGSRRITSALTAEVRPRNTGK